MPHGGNKAHGTALAPMFANLQGLRGQKETLNESRLSSPSRKANSPQEHGSITGQPPAGARGRNEGRAVKGGVLGRKWNMKATETWSAHASGGSLRERDHPQKFNQKNFHTVGTKKT